MMNVDQIFYGRGADGYAILGSSVPSCGLTDQVLDLCQSVGTPGFEREDDNQPFLLQKVCGANVLMVCGRNGEPDSLGRKTLFFHAVAAPLAYAKELRISAADLYRADVFATKYRDGKLLTLEIDHVKGQSDLRSCDFKFPAVFSCRRANNLALVKLLDGRLVGTNWATMSWKTLPEFDWFGLDSSCHFSRVSAGYAVYDGGGKLLRGSGAASADEKTSASGNKQSLRSEALKSGNMKKDIVFGIVGLMLGFGLGWGAWGTAEPLQIVESGDTKGSESQAEIEQRVRAELTSEIEKEVEVRLRPQIVVEERKKRDAEIQLLKSNAQAERPWPVFDEKYRIKDFKVEMKKDGLYKSAVIENPDDSTLKAERELFAKLRYYVEFVNGHFVNKKSNK